MPFSGYRKYMAVTGDKPAISGSSDSPSGQIRLFTCPIKVRWGDMDAMGHVNNTCYFRYCEQARMEWFAGVDLAGSEAAGSQIVIINAFCEFLVPVVYPSSLIVEMYADAPGNSSFMSHYIIREDTAKGTVYCNGKAKIVWVNEAGTKSVAMPDTVRSLFS